MIFKVKNNLFYISYTLMFISLFLGDVNVEIEYATKYLRYAAYLFLIVLLLFNIKLKIKEIFVSLMWFAVSALFFFMTGDLFWSMIVLIVVETMYLDLDYLFNYQMLLIGLGIVIVITLCIFGVLPDKLTAREGMDYVGTRHSFGFVHSNVLPLLIVYFALYYLWTKKDSHYYIFFMLFIGIELIVYKLCDARNSIVASVIMFCLFLIFRVLKGKKTIKLFEWICIMVAPALSFFSLAMTTLLLKGGIYDVIDSYFSGRFRVAILKIRDVGLHFINLMTNAEFFKDNIVIDNGYLYVALRYGVVFLLFYFVVFYLLIKQANKSIYKLICIFVLILINFIDNDLVDYSFLPFIIMAFNKMSLQKLSSITGNSEGE